MIVEVAVICVTVFELPYFVRRCMHACTRWHEERAQLRRFLESIGETCVIIFIGCYLHSCFSWFIYILGC